MADRYCELLVVGGGPAGTMAAQTAAEAGLDVVVVEARRRFGERPHCAGFAPKRLALEVDFPPGCVAQEVAGVDIHLQGLVRSLTVPGFILDRGLFDHGLAQAAAVRGAELRCGFRLVGYDGEACLVEGPAGPETIRSRAIIAADGPGSKLRKFSGLSPLICLTGVQLEVTLSQAMDRARIMFHQAWRHGYAWLFPKGRTANLGLGLKEELPGEARQALEALRSDLEFQGLIRPGCLGRSVGAIPVSGPTAPLFVGRVMLAGDAAGLTHPITGAGLPQALASGRAAGLAAAGFIKGDPVCNPNWYDKEMQAWFGRTLSLALTKRHLLETNWHDRDFVALIDQTWPGFSGYQTQA
jgi:geranylgeranyl reductase family protein